MTTYTDLAACNKALAKDRAALDWFDSWAQGEAARMRQEAAELTAQAGALDSARVALASKRGAQA